MPKSPTEESKLSAPDVLAQSALSIRELFQGVDSPTTLPLRGDDQSARSHEIAVVGQELSEKQSLQLREFVLEQEVHQDTLVQLAWGVLLNRYGAGPDVLFDANWSSAQGRPDRSSDTVGPHSAKLPVRVQMDPDQTIRETLRAHFIWQMEMRQHLGTPLEELQPPSTSPYQTRVICEPNRPDAESRYPLCLTFEDNRASGDNDGFSNLVSLDYDTGLYDAQTANQLLDNYCHILIALTKNLDRPLRELDVLSPAMRQRLIDQQCAREQPPLQPSVLARVLEQCESQPQRLAIGTFDGPSMTYGQLGQRVKQLARTLRRRGVAEGDIVAIHVKRSIEAVVAMLAVNAAGGAFLPLDVRSPVERRLYMLEDARVGLVLMDGWEQLETDIEKLRVDQEFELSSTDNDSAVELPAEPTPTDGLAYVIYTSGSTGKPKGVCIQHRALANHIFQTKELFELKVDDRALLFGSLSFDSSLEETFTPLAFGASVWLRNDEMVSSARAFFEHVKEQGVTIMTLSTAFWHQLIHSQLAWPDCVRIVEVGGERIDPGFHSRFRESVDDDVRFINSYGPTEATVACTFYDDRAGDHDATVLPIGGPMGGASCFILDDNLVPVPLGVEGQLYVGGAGLARGYLHREALTAERFIAHPFRDQGRLYATGDLVRHTQRGNIVYIDRIDHQVKVQGYRVELGEIETLLRSHQAVEEAVVIPLQISEEGGMRLQAFAQVPEEGLVDSTDLKQFVADALPAYMVPRQLDVLSSLPQTPAGKVDRQALIASTKVAATNKQSGQHAAGWAAKVDDPLQEKLLGIWSEMLREPISDPHVDFFEIGGDSLLAVRLFTEIERELQVQCSPHEFFKEPTVAALARLVRDENGTDFKSPLLPLYPEPADVQPLFFAPTVSGHVADYFHLAESLKGVVPMYGLQMRGLRDGDDIHDDLRDAAKFYIGRMREVQPEGPYSLAGYSAGGTVCLAIAEALHEQGECTDLLLMLDAVPPKIHFASPFSNPRRLWRLCRTTIDRIQELTEEENFFANLVNRGKPALQRLWAKVWPGAKDPELQVEDLFNRSGLSELTREEALRMQAHLETTIDFQPRGCPLDVVLVRCANDPFEGPFERDLGWSQAIAGDTTIEVISVRHNDFLDKKHVEPLAEIMKRHLQARADANG